MIDLGINARELVKCGIQSANWVTNQYLLILDISTIESIREALSEDDFSVEDCWGRLRVADQGDLQLDLFPNFETVRN